MNKILTGLSVLVLVFVCLITVSYADGINYEATATEFAVSPVFDDGMVLQQNEPIKIWGTSPCEGETVVAILKDSVGVGTVSDGVWEITMAPRASSTEPMVLEIYGASGSDYVTYENITVGDVWWVMGQSNVQYSSSTVGSWNTFESQITGEENIVLYDLPENAFEQSNRTRWRRFSRYSAYDTSALACYTAKNLSDACNNEIPIAMVTMGYAGHEIASFMPHELTDTMSYAIRKSDIYDSVIQNVLNMPVKGIIWYQGEADASMYVDYNQKMAQFVEWMRNCKNQAFRDFPIYSVELCPCFPNDDDPNWQYLDFGNVRAESCSLTASLPNFNVCVTSDLWNLKGFPNNLHPDNKPAIAYRLSAMILAREYGFGSEYAYFGPAFKDAGISEDGSEAVINFEYVGDGLAADKFSGFQIIGQNWKAIEDAEFEIISPSQLKIKATEKICAVRYNSDTDDVFDETVFLKNSAGIPAAAFSVTFFSPAGEHGNALDRRQIGIYIFYTVIFIALITSVAIIWRNKSKKIIE